MVIREKYDGVADGISTMSRKAGLLLSVVLCLLCLASYAANPKGTRTNILPDWAIGGFVRPLHANPIIIPNATIVFDCPMRGTKVGWEESDVFNPAATVKNGKICVLYRAEDNSAKGIGTRTSRIGLAESVDGITMKRRTRPVMFPDNDVMKEFEWPGGCEDPRVAVLGMDYMSWLILLGTAKSLACV